MAFVHGRNSEVEINSVDLSAFTNNTVFSRAGDEHDVTTYGQTGHVWAKGLTNGTATISGIYDNGASSPAETLRPMMVLGVQPFEWRPEGTGTGLPTITCNTLVTAYEETSPVADMIAWSATLRISGAVTDGTQA